jgi:transcriptional regulator with XRE-family HTH domain
MLNLRPLDDIRKEMREKMAKDGISARKIMRECGISHVTINGFLNGTLQTQDATVIKLCLYLGLNWDSRREISA